MFLFYRVNNSMPPPSGQIIMGASPPPKAPTPPAQSGSAINAAGEKLLEDKAVMAGAVNALGGGRSRSRRRRHRTRRHRGGGEVAVSNIPNFVSAGGTDPKQMFAGLMKTADTANADAAYDKLGNAPPMQMGGRRRIKKSRKHNGRRSVRKHRRSRRVSRRVRRSMV